MNSPLDQFLDWERNKRALSYGVGGFEDTKSEIIKVLVDAIEEHDPSTRDKYDLTLAVNHANQLAKKALDT